jgi:cytidylate kinase
VVALDGPSGAGKSTASRGLARALELRYLDTGAMYRAIALAVLRAAPGLGAHLSAGAAPTGEIEQQIGAIAAAARIEISTAAEGHWIRLAGEDVSAQIRTPQVTAAVSAVSAAPAVRRRLVELQREIIGPGGIVVEGRDIASVVWPAAHLKVYLTASAAARAARRAGELDGADVEKIGQQLLARDGFDSGRADSPLTRADGARILDTSQLSIDGVVQRLVEMTRAALGDA